MWPNLSIQIRNVSRILLLVTALAVQLLYGQEPSDDAMQLLLLSQDIATSSASELRSRAQALDLPREEDVEQLRRQLLDYYQIEALDQLEREDFFPFQLSLVSADKLYRSGKPAQYLLLEGEVQLYVHADTREQRDEIVADRVVIDLERSYISALGSVVYQREEQQITGEAVSIDYRDGTISVTEGRTEISRENTDGEAIYYRITSDTLDVSSEQMAIAVDSGVISTQSEQQYFSIASDQLYMVSGGDILATGATVSLGRIPILWVPFIFYPGQTFVFNPVMGYATDKGAFFSSSWALYGRYPIDDDASQSSLSSLLSSSQQEEMTADGWVFRTKKPKKTTWAERSDSYLALLFDTYQHYGVFVGYDTVNQSIDDRFTITSFGGLGIAGTAPVSGVYTIPPLRYFMETTALIHTELLDMSLSLPVYSDPKVMRNYGNRLQRFSLQSLMGNATFPTTYRSDITEFDWEMKGSLTIPTQLLAPVIEQLRIDHVLSEAHWEARTEGYEITSLTAPEVRATLSGTIFSWTSQPVAESDSISSQLEPGFSYTQWAVEPPFNPGVETREVRNSSASLRYAFNQYLIQAQSITSSALSDPSWYARTSGSIDFSATIAPRYLTIRQRLLPIISYHETEKETTDVVSLSSTTDITIPAIGLSYVLSARLYHRATENGGWESWDSDAVTRHNISWNHTILFGKARITPSMTVQLPPRTYAITPQVSFKQGYASASVSTKLSEQSDGTFSTDDVQMMISYQDPSWVTWYSEFIYEMDEVAEATYWIDPLTWKQDIQLKLCDEKLSLASQAEYVWIEREFEHLSFSTSVPFFSLYLQAQGPVDQLDVDFIDTEVTIDAFTHTWWKNRISLAVDLSSTYRHALSYAYTSLFTFGIDIRFAIAEFLTLDIALDSINTGINRYQSVHEVWEDLWRSFDIFGDGRHHTFFTMESLSISLIHHMADWDLHCKYAGSVVLSDLEWQWSPTFSVFLQWKAIPEITVNRSFDMRSR
jgi:hypothetical protein